MSITETTRDFQLVDHDHASHPMAPEAPPPRRPPPPEDRDEGWRFDGDDQPTGSRLNNAHLGMLIFLVAETMLFAALMGAFLVVRVQTVTWSPPILPRLPVLLTGCSTVMLLFSAYTMKKALHALRSWDQKGGIRFLALTAGLGGLFLALQGYEWSQLIRFGMNLSSGIYGALFFLLIGCHAFHVMSALTWVMVVWFRTQRAEDCLTRPVGASLCSLYWYYVVAVWPILYGLVYLF